MSTDLSPELVAIAIEAFNREGGKRAASQFLWTIAEPQMKAALTAALPLLEARAAEKYEPLVQKLEQALAEGFRNVEKQITEKVLRDVKEFAHDFEVGAETNYVSYILRQYAIKHALDLTQHSQKVDP